MKKITKRSLVGLMIALFSISTFAYAAPKTVKVTKISFDLVYNYTDNQFESIKSEMGLTNLDYVSIQSDYINELQKRISRCTNATKKQKLLSILKLANQKLVEYKSNTDKITYFEDRISRTSYNLEKAKYKNQLNGIKSDIKDQFIDYAFYKVEYDLMLKDKFVGKVPASLLKNNKNANINSYSLIEIAALNLLKNQYKAYKETNKNDEYLTYLQDKLDSATDQMEKSSWQHEIDKYETNMNNSSDTINTDSQIYELGITKLNKGKTATEINFFNLTFQNALKDVTIEFIKNCFGTGYNNKLFNIPVDVLE